jgi:alkylation response protein AidB-like acyl-CoA dehydrogenase
MFGCGVATRDSCSSTAASGGEAFRAQVRTWLAEHVPAWRARCGPAVSDRDHFDAGRAWQRELFDGGWAGIPWPAEYGGRGGSVAEATIFGEEQSRCAVSAGFVASTIGMVGPVLLRYGNDAQRARYLRPLLRADETWCQLFSEPSAGSDLANLATRAERHGAELVVNGQKVWTSNAHLCDYAILLVRTNPDAPKHRGITFLLLDLRTPGVDVRPLRQITGAAHFNEVFLTDVRVPLENVVGEIDGGWAPARAVLAHEASVIGGGNAAALGYAALASLARALDRAHEPVVRQRLALAFTREQILQYMKQRVQHSLRAGGRPDIDGSVMKVLWSEARRERAELGVYLLGGAGALDGEWPTQLLEQFTGTIGGGTNEVHRTMIGEGVLGLPPEPRVDREQSYRELSSRSGAPATTRG